MIEMMKSEWEKWGKVEVKRSHELFQMRLKSECPLAQLHGLPIPTE